MVKSCAMVNASILILIIVIVVQKRDAQSHQSVKMVRSVLAGSVE